MTHKVDFDFAFENLKSHEQILMKYKSIQVICISRPSVDRVD